MGCMFRTISIISFIVAFAAIAVHYVACLLSRPRKWRPIEIIRKLVRLLTLLLLEQRLSAIGILKKLIYLLALFCFAVLLITGFGPRLILHNSLSGYWLMVHATFAPVFALCLVALAVMWAYSFRFKSDCRPLPHPVQPGKTNEDNIAGGSILVMKICFWLICVLALPLFLSIVLSMFPLFGTNGQELLFQLHRYSALLLALAAIVHIYLLITTQLRKQ